MSFVYLDHNATTPVRPEVARAVSEALTVTGNPSSVHAAGRRARSLIEDARDCVALLVGGRAADVVWTSGGTEANGLALCGSGRRRLLAAASEHHSVLQARDGIETIGIDADGCIDLADLDDRLAASPQPALVSVMLANNETGIVQPIAAVVAAAHRRGVLVHCDAVQAAGRIPIDMTLLGVDFLTLSAHKMGGPQGVGAVVMAPGRSLEPILRGGGQERGRRAGTENLPGIVGFGVAAGIAARLADCDRMRRQRDELEAGLLAATADAVIFGRNMPRLPNTCCVGRSGAASRAQVIAFDLAGVAVSAGSACSSGKVAASHVLTAMGVDDSLARAAIRVSLGWTTTDEDVARFIETWAEIHRRHGRSSDAGAMARPSQTAASLV